MAEAAAMALGAAVTDQLQLHHTNFLSDSQELVSFFNANDHSNPPDWRIKYLTKHFIDYMQYRSTSTFKLTRSQNQTADSLARQALLDEVFASKCFMCLFKHKSCQSVTSSECTATCNS